MPHSTTPINSVSISASQIDDPQTLNGLFPPDSDDDGDSDEQDGNANQNCYEIQSVQFVGEMIKIRQYDYHSHNANRIWPGSFPLAEYLLQQEPHTTISNPAETLTNHRVKYLHQWGRILELGTATGLIAIRLAMACSEMKQENQDKNDREHYCCTSIVTSDVDDEYGDIASNLLYNYTLNHMSAPFPYHIPHTWGTGFQKSIQNVIDKETSDQCNEDVMTKTNTTPTTHQYHVDSKAATPKMIRTEKDHPLYVPFDTIIASDILLYVSAYPALVETLSELMIPSSSSSTSSQILGVDHDHVVINKDDAVLPQTQTSSSLWESSSTTTTTPTITTTTTSGTDKPVKFIMSWNRRLKESQEFFVRMTDAGFIYEHHGKGIYTFVYDDHHERTLEM